MRNETHGAIALALSQPVTSQGVTAGRTSTTLHEQGRGWPISLDSNRAGPPKRQPTTVSTLSSQAAPDCNVDSNPDGQPQSLAANSGPAASKSNRGADGYGRQ